MKIDPKDLMPLTYPVRIGGIFYLLNPDGSYDSVRISQEEANDPQRAQDMRTQTEIYQRAGRLFVTRGRPYESVNNNQL